MKAPSVLSAVAAVSLFATSVVATSSHAHARELEPRDDRGGHHSAHRVQSADDRITHVAATSHARVAVTLRDYTIAMSRHRLVAGQPVTLVITNRGKAMHEVVLARFGAGDHALHVGGKEYEAEHIAPGTTRTVTWTVPHTGKYELACHMPGHYQMGMRTAFTVVGTS
jgi:uncharacterized cupredoxin-like copper-binding protein